MANAVVHTPSGRIEGEDRDHGLVFRGIPFAAPPVGPLRFRGPEKLRPWEGVRQAREFGPSAPQVPATIAALRRLLGTREDASEDCLYLNVWTPAADGKRRPVMVWIHGGAFLLGSGSTSLYSGARLAARGDVVVVTINYRLGVLGSLDMLALREGGSGIEPNLGIRDQLAALEWVRDHIETFGGDPENVTVFGESAGGMSVGTLLGMPAAHGLFHRAILQSGASSNVSPRPVAERIGRAFLRYLGTPRANSAQLRRVPLGRILAAQTATVRELANGVSALPWQPTVDGEWISEPPLDVIRRGDARHIPVLLGTTANEWNLFMAADAAARRLDEPGLQRRFRRVLGSTQLDEILLERVAEVYHEGRGTPSSRWSRFMSDLIFHAPATLLADTINEGGGNAWLFRFDGKLPLVGGMTGSFHGLDIPFVFGTVRRPPFSLTIGLSAAVRQLSREMQRAWVAFAHTGDPNHEGLGAWPSWTEDRKAMVFDNPCRLVDDPHAAANEFWGPLLAPAPVVGDAPLPRPALSAVQPPRVARE